MLLFFSIIIIIFTLIIMLLFSEIKFKINDFELLKSESKKDVKYNVKIGLYLLGKLPIISFKLSNKKSSKFIKKSYIEKLFKNIPQNNNKQKVKRKTLWNLIRKNGKVTSFKLEMYIDVEDVLITSYLVGIISSVIPVLLRNNIDKVNPESLNYRVLPVYKNQNFIYLKLNSIFNIKLVHIINMFTEKMGGNKNERSSDRRFNVNCYGKY